MLTKQFFFVTYLLPRQFFRFQTGGVENANLCFYSQIFTYGCGLKSSTGGPLKEMNIKSDVFNG